MITCSICGRTYEWIRSKGHTKTKCNSCMANLRRKKLKSKIVKFLGGKCIDCGFSKCIRALDVHHLYAKDFNISGNHTRRWSVLEKELEKCVLLCSNCHRIRHCEL